jgi:hypothetical protein
MPTDAREQLLQRRQDLSHVITMCSPWGVGVALLKAVELIVGSPYRSRGWKVFDVSLLCILWTASILSVLIWQAGNVATGWDVVVIILPSITVIATARVW